MSLDSVYGTSPPGAGVEMKQMGSLLVSTAPSLDVSKIESMKTKGYMGSLERDSSDLMAVSSKPYVRLFKSGTADALVHTLDKAGNTPFAMVLERMGRLEKSKAFMIRPALLKRGQTMAENAAAKNATGRRSSAVVMDGLMSRVRSASSSAGAEEKKEDRTPVAYDSTANWRARLQMTTGDLEKVLTNHLKVEEDFAAINGKTAHFYKPEEPSDVDIDGWWKPGIRVRVWDTPNDDTGDKFAPVWKASGTHEVGGADRMHE
jgi:hypothetical protein